MVRANIIYQAASAPIALMLAAAVSSAVAAPAEIELNIPEGALVKALEALATQAHVQLLYPAKLVAGRTTPGLHGAYTLDRALRALLTGSDLEVEEARPGVLLLKRKAQVAGDGANAGAPIPTARSADDPPLAAAPAPLDATRQAVEEPANTPEIVVTGSHIRGVRTTASPLVTLTQDAMFRDGDATVADALAKLPQTFNGSQSPVNTLDGSDRTGTNIGYAQGVNLRGLGASATLVLINGRRMAGTGNLGDFPDVSAIPSAAVDHVDVLLDGASAIYGSDAVGGVVNIVTKSNYQGADTTVRYGQDEGGAAGAFQASQVVGIGWSGGHLLATYDYQHTDRLPSSSRRFTANSDLTGLGGTNHDSFDASPGNILGLNAAGTGYTPAYAIPAGDGLGLTPASFTPGAANQLNTRLGTDVTPDVDQSTVYVDAVQDLGARTTVDIEGRYSLRHVQARETPAETILSVTPDNPYYVSPNGAASELIGYSLADAVGPEIQDARSQSYDYALGLTHDMGRTWRVQAYVAYAGEVARSDLQHLINSVYLNEALGTTPDNPATPFSTAVDGYFNPYGSGVQNSALLRNFVGSGYDRSTDVSATSTASVQADGTLITLPAGTLQAAFGAQLRHERLEDSVTALVSGATPYVSDAGSFHRDVSSAFGELNIPLLSPAMMIPAVERLDLSVAGRIEHYDDVGTTSNPKIGLTWRPLSDLSLHATYGTSFRAPSLSELAQPSLYEPINLTTGGATTLVLLKYGGNEGLKPETATTWTAGLDWTPAALRGLHLGATWYDIEFTNMIGNPGVTYISTVLTNPALASLVTRLNPSNPADLALIDAALAKAAGTSATLFPATAYGAIVDARYLNTAAMHVSGVDLTGDYTLAWRGAAIALNATGSYLDTFRQTQVAGAPENSLLNTPNEPVSFRGRLSLDWSKGPYEARATANYVGSYRDPVAERSVDSWTTLDLSLIWRAPQTSGALKGLTLSLFVHNLFDTDPPFYDNPLGVGYDSANADPFGRVISFQAAKHW